MLHLTSKNTLKLCLKNNFKSTKTMELKYFTENIEISSFIPSLFCKKVFCNHFPEEKINLTPTSFAYLKR